MAEPQTQRRTERPVPWEPEDGPLDGRDGMWDWMMR